MNSIDNKWQLFWIRDPVGVDFPYNIQRDPRNRLEETKSTAHPMM